MVHSPIDSLSKEARLKNLAETRQQTAYEGYKNLGDFHNGGYECDFVSPYTKSANNVDSSVFVMLQDWASEDFLSGPFCAATQQYGRTPDRPTNKNLDRLIKEHFQLSISEIYASNLFPFIKPSA